MDRLGMNSVNNRGAVRTSPAPDSALASEIFDRFCNATTMKTILGYHRQLCDVINLKPNHFPVFYPRLKQYVNSWRAKALWKKFDVRASHKCYARGKACPNTRVLIVGAGPCGLRTAIEAQLLGAKVVVVEKRDRMSRNNVLHLWPFVIEDLRALGAKKFFGKFCAGAIDHISIRQLQCILLKVALLLGVEVHTEISFMKLLPPPSKDESEERIGWRGLFNPPDHPVSQYEFDILIGADGRRNTLEGFNRKEFRGRLAIAITANFINKRTEAEARVEEISGVAFIFNQKFFKDLYEATGIDLENIVYYKDDTHYFVMTAKKQSLLEKGVILNDIADTSKLLGRENVDVDALQNYAREAAEFSTQYQMPDLEFAVNHYGNPDVNMFDFTSMYAAENASKVLDRNGHRLLMILVGDSLLEPFWPTGSGCARGFLSSMDACWAIRGWGSGTMTPLEVLAERESIYRLLGQTTPENLQRDSKSYTLDPSTRYPNLNKSSLLPLQVTSLYDTDDPNSVQAMITAPPVSVSVQELHKKRRRRDSQVHPDTLLSWLKRQIVHYQDLVVDDLTTSFKDGLVLCAVIHRYRPDLLDFHALKKDDIASNNQLAFDILEKELGIPPVMTGQEMAECVIPDLLTMLSYLTQIYDLFRGEIPHIKQPKLTWCCDNDDDTENHIYLQDETEPFICQFIDKQRKPSHNHLKSKNTIVNNNNENFCNIDNCKSKLTRNIHTFPMEGNEIIENNIGDQIPQTSKKELISKVLVDIYQKVSSDTEKKIENLCKTQAEKSINDPVFKTNTEDTYLINREPYQKTIQYFLPFNYKDLENSETGEINYSDASSCSSESLDEQAVKELDYEICQKIRSSKVHDPLFSIPEEDDRLSEKSSKTFKTVHESESLESQYFDVLDLPEVKKVENILQPREFANVPRVQICAGPNLPSRFATKHRRYGELAANTNFNTDTMERKTRKRRSVEKVGATLEERQKRLEEIVANRNERMSRRKQHRKKQTEQFIKSMQMLHANAKFEEGGPFEDYSIFLYRQTAPNFEDRVKDLEQKLLFPDREIKIPGNQLRGEKDEDFSGRIKDFEDKLRETAPQEKKPKDLLRAIGKIETTDWNVKEIEKKIIENKMGKSVNKEKERVPKWSSEQFHARRTKMEKRGLERQESDDKKYAAIDKSLKLLDQKLKEGNIREHTQNKVSAITENFKKQPKPELKPVQKSNSKVIVPAPGGSENCHFCAKRVYLMERLSAEGRFFHRGCFRCQYCNTILRLGSYLFDRDGKYGHKFYCSQHFGMTGQLKGNKVVGKHQTKTIREHNRTPEKIRDVTGIDFIDRVQTPERIEFSNMSPATGLSDHEESFSQMDEDEWTDRNFGASTAELGTSDEDSSDSDSESDDDEAFEEALDEQPVTKEGTHRLAKEWVKRYSKDAIDDDDDSPDDYDTGSDFSYENSSDDDESDTATEGEEEIRARELRKQEVRVKQPIVQTDTGSDTEMASDEETEESSSDKENSATDIPTDSEFDHDDRTPTGEIPAIMLNDVNVTKTRGSGGSYYSAPKKVQVKSGELQRPINTLKTGHIELKFTPLPATAITQKISSPDITNVKPTPLVNPRKGDYLLNRTQSTGGIASKVSLELKKKYLLGSTGLPGSIQKSGSTTTLDSKFKSFHSNISEHQKLLNPAPEISPTMQAFLQGTSKIRTPLSPTITPKSPTFPTDNKFDHFNVTNQDSEKPKEIITKQVELKSPEIIDLTLSPNDKFSMQPDITKNLLPEDTIIESCESPKIIEDCQPDICYTNDTEGRPRSPVHETSIIVPEIPWNEINKPEKKDESDIDTDSLSSESLEIVEEKSFGKVFNEIPRVEVHDATGELLQDDIVMDSLCIIPDKTEILEDVKNDVEIIKTQPSSLSEAPKSILSEKKTLNQPKILPVLEHVECSEITKCVLENKKEITPEIKEDLGTESKNSSGRNTPISDPESICNDATTAALTETELSDWARDGAVSDNLEDVEFDINPEIKSKKSKTSKKKNLRADARIAISEDFEDTGHVCGKDKSPKDIPMLTNGAPIADLDSIEYMDTGSEVSLEENFVQTTNTSMLKNRGYVHFVQEEENIPLDSLNPVISQESPNNNEPLEAVNKNVILPLSSAEENTGYCVFGNENENYEGKFNAQSEIKPEIAEKEKQIVCDNEDDSLLVIEAGTTTEENTISDSTVKNLINESKTEKLPEYNDEKNSMEQKEAEDVQTPLVEDHNGIEYDEHVKRLQSKYAEFGFVRDSIDVRKSKRKNKSDSPPLEIPPKEDESPKRVMSPVFSSPATSRKLEEINKERSKQQDLIRDLVLDKVKSQKKSGDKKRRIRESFSPSCSPVRRNFDLSKSATVDISPNLNDSLKNTSEYTNPLQKSPTISGFEKELDDVKENVYPSDKTEVLTSTEIYTPVASLKDLNPKTLARPLSMHGSFIVSSKPLKQSPTSNNSKSDNFSLPNIHHSAGNNEFKTPIAPPRPKHEEAKRTAEKLKQDARSRARLMSDEDLGLSPEDIHRQKVNKLLTRKASKDDCIQDSIESLVLNTEKRNAMLLNDTLKKKRSNGSSSKLERSLQNSFSNSDIPHKLSLYNEENNENIERSRTKSVSEICKTFNEDQIKMSLSSNMIHRSESQRKQQFYKSDPNLLTETGKKEKKTKDRERRKSIIKSVTEFFHKKKESSNKSPPNSSNSGSVKDRFSRFRISPKSKEKSKERNLEPPSRSKSLSDSSVKDSGDVSPPPIPPPPLNYSINNTRDESGSEDDIDWKKLNQSTETLDQSCAIEGSANSLGRRRGNRSLRKSSKQATIKRHRLAQEIQRKLEETEVKTRELEQRGVMVEKALRGETTSDGADQREEADLLREWFDLMRDRTELRRYEKELLVRAQELELEDRHARLQQELRERLAGDDKFKTQDDVAAEGAILSEMLEIVAKRDSLIALLEEDRQRLQQIDDQLQRMAYSTRLLSRYHEEDRDFEAQMLAKGLRLTPIKKTPD